MAPSFVLCLDPGKPFHPADRPFLGGNDTFGRDEPLPEAVRWLTRRVEVQCMAVELPVEGTKSSSPVLMEWPFLVHKLSSGIIQKQRAAKASICCVILTA
eukprot:scaffold187411_cov33-Prasinocladus_malaysianus.AAC.1